METDNDQHIEKEVTIDKLIRSRRMTLSLEISRDAKLIVRAPATAPLQYIEQFISSKHLWILKKQRFVQERFAAVRPKMFVDAEQFLYLGNSYGLHLVDNGEQALLFDEGFKLSKAYIPKARELFIDWYRQQAYQRIKERVDWYAGIFGLTYNKFGITGAKRLFGSCSAHNNLHFAWRLVMAPLQVVDYVVIHELAHIEVKNHSKRFWNKVRTMLPDYQRSITWLKENDHLLVI